MLYLIKTDSEGYGYYENYYFIDKRNAINFALKEFNNLVVEEGGIEEWEDVYADTYTSCIQKINNFDFYSDYLEMIEVYCEDEQRGGPV